MSSPETKRKRTATSTAMNKKPSPSPQLPSLLSLPHHLLLTCIARISRLYYPTLSLVSKTFRFLVASPELYKARSVLGQTHSCLYLCMRFYRDPNPIWFTLCLKPDQTLVNYNSNDKKKKKSSAYVLAKVSIPDSTLNVSGLVSVGSCIYNIGGRRTPFLHEVSVLDCGSYTWRERASLPVEVTSLTASVLDGKIYVAGCYDDEEDYSNNCLQVLDIETGIWDPETVPCLETKEIFRSSKSLSFDGKFHVRTGLEVVAYSPSDGKWNLAPDAMRKFMMYPDSYCVIGDVLYSVYKGVFRWYDTKVDKWRNLKGSGGGLPDFTDNHRVKLADYGGKMAILWDEFVNDDSEKMIWCAEVELVRRKRNEIWGIVKWFDHVLTLPLGYDFVKLLAVTV
ncbi:hypothetical protein AALP_AA8G337500 [Arabis alpina]|uniref:Uncharacterized protein n=1 Tax=Arabis alpina TaxID=50452 RepID=A0A087GB68_ARAAL|nr:hypothetical protein AALP_AA8G337500 [Arabis alpina]